VLPRKLPDKLLRMWDGAPIHGGQKCKNSRRQGAAKGASTWMGYRATRPTSTRMRASGTEVDLGAWRPVGVA
jgi:hypothetical protein